MVGDVFGFGVGVGVSVDVRVGVGADDSSEATCSPETGCRTLHWYPACFQRHSAQTTSCKANIPLRSQPYLAQ